MVIRFGQGKPSCSLSEPLVGTYGKGRYLIARKNMKKKHKIAWMVPVSGGKENEKKTLPRCEEGRIYNHWQVVCE